MYTCEFEFINILFGKKLSHTRGVLLNLPKGIEIGSIYTIYGQVNWVTITGTSRDESDPSKNN